MGLDMEYPLSAHISLATGLFHSNDIIHPGIQITPLQKIYPVPGIRLGISYI